MVLSLVHQMKRRFMLGYDFWDRYNFIVVITMVVIINF